MLGLEISGLAFAGESEIKDAVTGSVYTAKKIVKMLLDRVFS